MVPISMILTLSCAVFVMRINAFYVVSVLVIMAINFLRCSVSQKSLYSSYIDNTTMLKISLFMLMGLLILSCVSLFNCYRNFCRSVHVNLNHSRTPNQASVDSLTNLVVQCFLVLFIFIIMVLVFSGY